MVKKLVSAFAAAICCSCLALAYNAKELYTHLETVSFAKSPEVFYYFETDFDGDGAKEIWIAHDKSHSGGNGLYFHVYQKKGACYEMLDETPVLDTRLLAFSGKDASNKEKRIVTYFKHGATSGSLVSFKIKDGHVVEHEYQEIFPRGKDEDLFSKIFSDEHKIVREIPAKDLKNFLHERKIDCPTTDKTQLLGLDFGGELGETIFLSNPGTSFAAADWVAFHRKGGKKEAVPLRIVPKTQKLVFFCDFSFLRKIDGHLFLVCLERDAPRKTILRFYRLGSEAIHAVEIKYICVDEHDVVLDHPEAEHDYAFLEALNFDFEKESGNFHYALLDKKAVVQADGSMKIPGDIMLKKLNAIPEIKLPEGNDRTKQFRKLLKESEAAE